MTWKEFIDKAKDDFEKELQECIANKFNPCCHAANWNHLKDRIIKYFENPTELSVNKEWKLCTVRQACQQLRQRSMTELLFCMLRSGH